MKHLSTKFSVICLGLLGLSLAGCGSKMDSGGNSSAKNAPTKDSTPPIVVTAHELFSSFEKNKNEAKTKYGDRLVEVTGVLNSQIQNDPGMISLMFYGEAEPAKLTFKILYATFSKADASLTERLNGLSKGQSVVLRGICQKETGHLEKCELVSTGPNKAIPVTPSELLAALKTDEGKKKYLNHDVIMRAEVRSASWNNTIANLMVWDPSVAGGPGLEASINPNDKALGATIGKIKPGTVLILIGEAEAANDGRIWGYRILDKVPEGITLPSIKK